jgi:hypothetical protein
VRYITAPTIVFSQLIPALFSIADEEKENEDLENLDKQNVRLQEQLVTLPEKVEQLQRETKREEQNLETKKAELQRSEHNKKLRLKEYTSGISYYQQFLGLTYERVGGMVTIFGTISSTFRLTFFPEKGLRLVFTKVDAQNSSKEFYFSLSLNEANSYESTSVSISNIRRHRRLRVCFSRRVPARGSLHRYSRAVEHIEQFERLRCWYA